MLKIILGIFKFMLALLVVGALIFGVIWLIFFEHWPWWLVLAIIAGFCALVLGGIFLKKWWFRRREKKFVKRVIEEDKERIRELRLEEEQTYLDLQDRWRQAILILKKSSLKRLGDPLYALPWYMMLGPSGSGKTTALRSARLNAPLTEVTPGREQVGGTKSCDWWFIDNAVVMDTPGRFATVTDSPVQQQEWSSFLALLAKYRRREPLSGLVVALGADKLLSDDVDGLVAEARSMRKRVDEMMRVLGARFPVYLLITKMDLLPGFTGFADLLHRNELLQPMGWMNVTLHKTPEFVIEESIAAVTDRIKDLRLLLFDEPYDPSKDIEPERDAHHELIERLDPTTVLLAQSIDKLKPHLLLFASTLFDKNMYQETPPLRGLYFCSGQQRQAGFALPEPLDSFRKEPKPGVLEEGLFLRDFFTELLPADRRLYSPLFEFVRWRRLTHGLAMISALGLAIFVAGMLTYSYTKNVQVLNEYTQSFITVPKLSDDLRKNMLLLDKFRSQLLQTGGLIPTWRFPLLSYRQSEFTQSKLERIYCDLVRRGLEDNLDKTLSANILSFNDSTSEQILTKHIAHLVGRINLVDAKLNGASRKELESKPLPDERVLGLLDPSITPEIGLSFDRTYMTYLELEQNKEIMREERSELVALLKGVLQAKQSELNWIVDWANDQPGAEPVIMEKFWGVTAHPHGDTLRIAPAYTLKGRKMIMAFVDQVEEALNDPESSSNRVARFKAWYADHYLDAWEEFALHFPDGAYWGRTQYEWKNLAEQMTHTSNPYFNLLDTMAQELKPFTDDPSSPDWLRAVKAFGDIRAKASQQRLASTEKAIIENIQAGKTLFKQLTGDDKQAQSGQASGAGALKDPGGLKQAETVLNATEDYKAYEKALHDVLPSTVSSDAAFSMASSLFSAGKDPAAANSPFQVGHVAALHLEQFLASEDPSFAVFQNLLTGPLRLLLDYTMLEAANNLQKQWEANILAAISAAPEKKKNAILFDEKNGAVWKFMNGSCAPFVERTENGYIAKEFVNKKITFTDDFFRFVEQGAVEGQMLLPNYDVTISGLPTDVNDGVKQDPYATFLSVDCSEGVQKMENLNYPVSLTLKWAPDKCGDTIFQIKFKDFNLTKNYEGAMGFPKFLSDFRYGTRRFKPTDFPQQKDALTALGVQEIAVNYTFTGNMPVINLLHNQQRMDVPRTITQSYIY
jgi:type VI secretion system protein ImpL